MNHATKFEFAHSGGIRRKMAGDCLNVLVDILPSHLDDDRFIRCEILQRGCFVILHRPRG